MFDLDLIARRLAQHEADVRYETSNAKSDMDREAWETHLDEAEAACAEFAKLREALEDAPLDVVVADTPPSKRGGIIPGHVPADLIGCVVRLVRDEAAQELYDEMMGSDRLRCAPGA